MIGTYKRLKQRRDAGEINGFTLIELLIVIVVLGILAAVVIFALGGVTGQSAKAACAADGATISTAIAAFNAQNTAVTATEALLTNSTANAQNQAYVQSWPSNVPHYGYALTSDGKLVIEVNGPKDAAALTTWDSGIAATASTDVAYATGGNTAAQGRLYTGPSSCSAVV